MSSRDPQAMGNRAAKHPVPVADCRSHEWIETEPGRVECVRCGIGALRAAPMKQRRQCLACGRSFEVAATSERDFCGPECKATTRG